MTAETSADILRELRGVEGSAGPPVCPPKPPELVRTFHDVRLDAYGMADQESVSLTYRSSWRGTDVLVVMELKRTRSTRWVRDDGPRAEEWRPWERPWATSANEVDDRSDADPRSVRSGKGLTDLARRRLSDSLQDIAPAYLETAEYVEGRRRATLKAIDPQHNSHMRWADRIAGDIRAALHHCAEWLTAEDLKRGEELAAGYLALDAQRVAFVDG